MRNNPTSCFKFLIEAIFMVLMMLQQVDQLVCAEAAEVRCIEREKLALLDFKAGLVDDYGMLSSWKDDRDCCQWKGVGCSNLTGHSLDLHGDIFAYDVLLFLRGKISSSLVELQQLRYLNLNSNDFSDNHIPEFFGSLSNLRYRDLSFCYFVGKIPSQLGSLSHLKHLNLGRNELEGSIPYQLGNLSKLRYLDLGWNNLQGTIPSQLGSLSALQELYLGVQWLSHGSLRIDDGSHTGGQWLSNLTSLTHLDLSSVLNLNSSYDWLTKFGNLSQLRELSLGSCDLSDHFILSPSLSPSKFRFPHSLFVLDLSFNTFTPFLIFQWVSNVTTNLVELDLSFSLLEGSESNHFDIEMKSLERLDLQENKIKAHDIKFFANICTLTYLRLDDNELTGDLQSILLNLSSGCVSQSLQGLDLSRNQITGGILPDLSIFSSLTKLFLGENRLKGKIPESVILPSKLEYLSLAKNSLEGGIPKSFGNACNLSFLELSNNNLSQELQVIFQYLSGARYSLQVLDLSNNQFNGTMSDLSIFPSLEILDLSENRLHGEISEDIRFPCKLETLDINSNSLTGVITDFHFENMSELKILNLVGNPLALTFSHNWVPSFQLQVIKFGQCKLGPDFPRWMQTQTNLIQLDISNAEISDVIPDWFWALSTKMKLLDISYNNLTGIIPNFPIKLTEYPSISLASNQLEGSIPLFLQRAESLDLSNNKFSDFNSFVCTNHTVDRLGQLDLSSNHLSRQIPNCWSNFKSLAYIDLSNNNFSGHVPHSMGSVFELRVLILRNNSLTGELPFSLRSCTNLVMLDVGENRLTGAIPSWIGNSLPQLKMLSLRRNHFFASLPLSLCYLTSIHLLDLSSNSLKGSIPKCFKNFSAMVQEGFPRDLSDHTYIVNHTYASRYMYDYDLIALLMWKGVDHIVRNNKSIDLSSNKFSGDIPTELGESG